MNIKSLLIGSAATMVAVSGAQAADAVVVEPEPVEYVRVCDAYGTGFFFIPGTETCIAFNGFIRSVYSKQYNDHAALDLSGAADPLNPTAAELTAARALPRVLTNDDATWWGHRARFNMDTRNETEWGTLRGLFRLEADSNGRDSVNMDVALITLAGFRAGFAGGNYWSTNHGFGGINAEAAQFGFDGFYGFGDATLFDYTFAAEGFSVTIGVEDRRSANDNDFAGSVNTGTEANFYAGFNYSGDWGGVAFTAVHDSTAQEFTATTTAATLAANGRGEWAWKASVNLDLSSAIPGGVLWGWYMDDGDAATEYVSAGGNNASDVWGVAFQANLTDEVEFWANYWSADGGYTALDANSTIYVEEGDADQWAVGLNWYPSAAPGFDIKVAYMQGEFNDRVTQGVAARPATATRGARAATNAAITSTEYDAFEIVLRRNF